MVDLLCLENIFYVCQVEICSCCRSNFNARLFFYYKLYLFLVYLHEIVYTAFMSKIVNLDIIDNHLMGQKMHGIICFLAKSHKSYRDGLLGLALTSLVTRA